MTDLSPHWPQGLDFHLPLPEGNAFGMLARSAARDPDHPAMLYYGAAISYGRLLAEVEALAGHLHHACGVRKGDRVLIDMQNSPQFILAFQAILRCDAVVVPVNPMNMAPELAHYLADSGARVAMVGDELVERFARFLGTALDHLIVARYADALPDTYTDPLPEVMLRPAAALPPGATPLAMALAETRRAPATTGTLDDLAVMPYTSGTTGHPKACRQPHRAVVFTALAQAKWYGITPDSVMTAFMPLFHVAGMQASMSNALSQGATLLLMTRWNRDLIPSLFLRHGVTFWSAAPTMIVDVMASERFDERAFEKITVLTGGGSSMPAALAAKLADRYGLRFCEGYGLSETISATHINPVANPKPQCLGIPIFDTFCHVVEPGTTRVLAVGETGEILISGPQVMQGYWGRPEADLDAFVEIEGRRYLRTGDMGWRDDEDYYFITDRLKRMVNVSGFKVWPAECEALLYRHPDIQECAVIAVSDPRRGESVKAFVTLRPEARGRVDEDEVIAFARTVMAAYKVPRAVEFREALPRTGSNKIDWRSLQEAEAAKPEAGA
ncbi:long-chain-fatty-acid--CoA ligase [Frigidibacter sp. MR17.14]|uniref:long-chain-fatty-acid--CoA ligase n=1 Tax=Frigidibacter sp. MR17.14 TaxID=3126509 RepID=UPI0030130446